MKFSGRSRTAKSEVKMFRNQRKLLFDAGNKVLRSYPFLDERGWNFMRQLAEKIYQRTGGVVYSGPFAEMHLVPNSFLTSRPLWIVGCYEQEIHDALCDLITNPPIRIVDIGSAHGYYMVGLATQISDVPIFGFEEAVATHREEAKLLAELNSVSQRITQLGLCDVGALNSVIVEGSAIICDCEGAELDILNLDKCPALATSRIICEIHDFYRKEITRTLVDRFKKTHRIRLLLETQRDPNQYRILDGFSASERQLAVKESKHIVRGVTAARYLWMSPK
jgi:hypothetical protein